LVSVDTCSGVWVSVRWDTTYNGSADGYVVKLIASGEHLWSSYLGSSNANSPDYGSAIAVDTAGDVLVTGGTWWDDWMSGGWDTSGGGQHDGFVVKISDPPFVINPIEDFTVNEDAADTVLDLLAAFDPGLPLDTLVFSIVGNTNNSLVMTNIVGWDLTLSYGLNQAGTADITVRVTDLEGAGAWVENTFAVTVNPVNDAPTLDAVSNLTIDCDAEEQIVNLTGIMAGGGESQPLRVTAIPNSIHLIPNPTVIYTSPEATGILKFTPMAPTPGSTTMITVTVEDGGLDGDLNTVIDNATFSRVFDVTVISVAEVVGRHIFYNNSALAGDDPLPNVSDDAAIALDKNALLPGGIASAANYTSYWRGITGVMVDIAGLDAGYTPVVEDFGIRINESPDTNTWADLPAASVDIRSGAGLDGSDRITLLWDDGAIVNRWIEVTVKSNANGVGMGLAEDDIFYFGSSVADTDGDGEVGVSDVATLLGEFGRVGDNLDTDVNRDRRVDLKDFVIMRSSFGNAVATPTFQEATPQAPTPDPMLVTQEAAVESSVEIATPVVPVVIQPLDDSAEDNADDDAIAAIALASPIDLLVASPGSYIPEPQVGSSTATPFLAATAAYDLQTLSDDLLAGNDDYPGDDLGVLFNDANPFPDILAESLVTIPL
jgi:hypothetical protein